MRLRLNILAAVCFSGFPFLSTRAQIPSCDIWIDQMQKINPWNDPHLDWNYFGMNWGPDGIPFKFSGFYPYENQPAFLPDGMTVFYTVRTSSNQTDLFTYNLHTRATRQWMYTPESEYSPTVMPGGKSISCVVVEKDSAQRLWEFPLDGGKPKVLFPDIRDIGYHCWVSDSICAVFRLGETFTLHLLHKGKPVSQLIDSNIGRCIKKIPGENAFSYVLKKNDSDWVIRRYDMATGTVNDLIHCPRGSEDYEWVAKEFAMNNQSPVLFMGKGTEILLGTPGNPGSWTTFINYPSISPGTIGRIAIPSNWSQIAFVVNLPSL